MVTFGGIDPGCCGQFWLLRNDALEALGVTGECSIEDEGALRLNLAGTAVMNGLSSHEADAAVAVFGVVPIEETLTTAARIRNRAESVEEVAGTSWSETAIRSTGCRQRRVVGCGSLVISRSTSSWATVLERMLVPQTPF